MGRGNTEMLKYKSVDSHVNMGRWKKVPFVFLIHDLNINEHQQLKWLFSTEINFCFDVLVIILNCNNWLCL